VSSSQSVSQSVSQWTWEHFFP